MQFVAAWGAPYKKVRAFEFIDQIPKSPTGKILRRLLKERPEAARDERMPRDPLYGLARSCGLRPLGGDFATAICSIPCRRRQM
jgi:hypothetical protein